MVNLLYIAIICVIVTDFTDFFELIKDVILFIIRCIFGQNAIYFYIKQNNLHILSCSMCQTFWVSLLYTICFNNLTIFNIFLCIIAALSTKYIGYLIDIIDSLLVKIYRKIL